MAALDLLHNKFLPIIVGIIFIAIYTISILLTKEITFRFRDIIEIILKK